MSDKRPDERDIDEILASIDEMLSQKEPYTLQEDSRKDSVKEGVKASEDTLGLSSSVDSPELSEFDQVDIEEFLLLGVQDEQQPSTSQEEAQAKTSKDIDTTQTTTENREDFNDENIDFTLDNIDIPDLYEPASSTPATDEQENQSAQTDEHDHITQPTTSSQAPDDEHIQADLQQEPLATNNLDKKDFTQNKPSDTKDTGHQQSEPDLDEALPIEDEVSAELQNETTEEDQDAMPRHRILLTEELLEPSAQEALPLWIEQAATEHEHAGESNTEEMQFTKSTPETDTDSDDTEKSIEKEPEQTPQPLKNEVANQPADSLQNDDSVFDLDEDIGIDTVYKLETLTPPLPDDLDNHTELVEVMMEEVLQDDEEQPQNSDDEPEKETEKVFLSDDELESMVQAVSADVAQQIDDHLQTWLPGLISIAIKNHIKDLNNKD